MNIIGKKRPSARALIVATMIGGMLLSQVLVFQEKLMAKTIQWGVCFVHTRADLPKYIIIQVYDELYIPVAALSNLEERLKMYLTAKGINWQEKLFPFDNRCVMGYWADDNAGPERSWREVEIEFTKRGFTIVY